MEIKIYYDGKLDRTNQVHWKLKKMLWTAYVWADCYVNNSRFPASDSEIVAARDIAQAFAAGTRRPS